jgi:hypothetical protein
MWGFPGYIRFKVDIMFMKVSVVEVHSQLTHCALVIPRYINVIRPRDLFGKIPVVEYPISIVMHHNTTFLISLSMD